MKAAVLRSFGSPLAIETLPDPVLIVDVMATNGDGELDAYEVSPQLRGAVEAMIDREEAAGHGAWSRLVVRMSADTSIRTRVR